MKRVLAVMFTVLIGFVATVTTAQAGEFTVRQCFGAEQQGFVGQFEFLNNESHLDIANGCSPTGSGRIGVFQNLSGSSLTAGGGGRFRWTTPAAVSVIGTKFTNRLKDANGIQAGLFGQNGATVIDLDQGYAHDGTNRVSTWRNEYLPQQSIVASLVCHASGPCANNPSSAKAFVEVTDVEFDAEDRIGPTLNPGGSIWEWTTDGKFHRGEGTIQVTSADTGTGISTAWVEVNGLKINFAPPACPGAAVGYATRFDPCPASFSRSRTFDTSQSPFQEGVNTVQVCVADYADTYAGTNKACSATRKVTVDNKAPAPPVGLRVREGSDWRPTNGFNLEWRNPSDQVAPIVAAVYRITDPDTGEQTGAGYVDGEDVQEAGPIEVPAVGEHTVEVFLLDAALNWGSEASATLKFDDRPPSDVKPEPPSGWVSGDELPLRQEIERAEAGGPSGITGYSLAVSQDGPTPPCATGICLAPELTLNDGPEQRVGSIGGLEEGTHWVSAVAVSGARKSSLEPGSTVVEVDRTAPQVSIGGLPGNWVSHPVTLSVSASDELSGMSPRPGTDDGRPAVFLETEAYGVRESPGPTGSFAIASEGTNQIRYWAEDLAGNANDGARGPNGDLHAAPGRATVRVDMTEPEASFRTGGDPERPEDVVLLATDGDSGVVSGSIGIRPAGGDVLTRLPTTRREDSFVATVPSDDMSPGTYELVGEVTDRAGNVARVERNEKGGHATLNLPLKASTAVTAGFRGRRSKLKKAYGSRPAVEGRLTSGQAPLVGQSLIVTETFQKGGTPAKRTSTVRTDGAGRYRAVLRRGPSRTIQVRFAGSPRLGRAASRELALTVAGLTKFKIKRKRIFNGSSVKMSGRVGFTGALRPSRGKLVAIQYLDPARGKWRPVEVLRTRRSGKFSYRYRFRTIATAQRIVFRAVSLPEAGWPYALSTSGPRSVTVYPRRK